MKKYGKRTAIKVCLRGLVSSASVNSGETWVLGYLFICTESYAGRDLLLVAWFLELVGQGLGFHGAQVLVCQDRDQQD